MTITTNGAVTGVIQADQAAWLASSVSGAGTGSLRNGMWAGSTVAANQNSFGGYCWRLATEIPSHAKAFRVAVPKSTASTWTVDGIAVCATDTAANPARFDPGSGAAWVAGTFDGSTAAKTIPQFTPPDQSQAGQFGDVVWSDWIYCPTIPRVDTPSANPIVVISIYSASAHTACLNGGTGSDAGFNTEPMHRWDRFKAAAGSATVSFATNAGDPQCLPIAGIQFAPTVSAFALAAYGDSIMFGQKTSPAARGYVIKTASLLSTATGLAVSSVNQGLSGDRTISSLNRLIALCRSGGGLPNCVMFAPYSRNSTATMTNDQMMGVAEVFIKTCRKYGILPALVTAIAETATPANNTRAAAVSVMTRQIATDYSVPLIDMEPVITVANSGTYLDVDGIHPNNAGDDQMAATAATALAPWVPTIAAYQLMLG